MTSCETGIAERSLIACRVCAITMLGMDALGSRLQNMPDKASIWLAESGPRVDGFESEAQVGE